jgi:hypothetical protein
LESWKFRVGFWLEILMEETKRGEREERAFTLDPESLVGMKLD